MSDSSAGGKVVGTWLPRALVISALLHGMAWGVGAVVSSGGLRRAQVETVDIELAPVAPKAELLPQERAPVSAPEAAAAAAALAKQAAEAQAKQEAEEDGVAVGMDAGIDARPDAMADAGSDAMTDARPKRKKKPKPDAGPDAMDGDAMDGDAMDAMPDGATDAVPDGGIDAPDGGDRDATPAVATATGSAEGGPLGDGAGPARDGGLGDGALAAATDTATDARSGDGGVTSLSPEDGLGDTPTSAGTAANLLAYFPPGHVVTAMIRFDRLRGTRWAEPAEELLLPMPDYRSLFGDGNARLVDKFDTLVISSPRPQDPTATTLAGRSKMSRPELRRFFAQQKTPIAWTTVRGGALGTRSGDRMLAGDTRVILSPRPGWFFLAPPADLPGLTTPARGATDAAIARGKLPAWLERTQTIEAEAGDEWGPALIVTMTATRARWKFPDLGLGVTSIPGPERATVAMELVKQGWVVRGNVKLATEAEAEELATAIETMRQRVADSSLLQAMLKRGHALNAVLGLTVQRTGTRVAYATSLSIKDAQIFLQLAGDSLEQYFGQARRAQPAQPVSPQAPAPR